MEYIYLSAVLQYFFQVSVLRLNIFFLETLTFTTFQRQTLYFWPHYFLLPTFPVLLSVSCWKLFRTRQSINTLMRRDSLSHFRQLQSHWEIYGYIMTWDQIWPEKTARSCNLFYFYSLHLPTLFLVGSDCLSVLNFGFAWHRASPRVRASTRWITDSPSVVRIKSPLQLFNSSKNSDRATLTLFGFVVPTHITRVLRGSFVRKTSWLCTWIDAWSRGYGQ